MKILKNEQGLTLVEVLMAIALSSIIAYVLFQTTRYGEAQINNREARMTIQDAGREGLYKMAQEIRQSAPTKITIGNSGASITFSVPDPSNLVTSAYAVNWTGAHTINYALGGTNNTQIIRTDQTSNKSAVIANDVTGLAFAGNSGSPTVVTITMSVQRTLTNGRLMPATPLQLTTQAEVRNH